jgi:hypothetical protein
VSDVKATERSLSALEADAVAIIRLNQATPSKEVRRKWRVGRWRFTYSRRSKDNLWGRFGGGWNWKLGFQAGGRTVILALLVASLTISRERP